MVSWRYKGPPLGWGTATFRTPEARNNFLKDRPKHRLGSKIVDVKEYYWEERPEPGTVPAPAPVPKPAPVPVPIPREPFTPQWKSTSLDQALQNCQTGKIARYVVSFDPLHNNVFKCNYVCHAIILNSPHLSTVQQKLQNLLICSK